MFFFILRCFNVIITCELVGHVLVGVILTQPQVPSDARDGRDRSKLVDDVAGKKVNVVVVERDARVFDALAAQLVQLRVLDPRDALRDRRLVKVELELFGEEWKRLGGERDDVFRDAVLLPGLTAVNGFKDA